MDAPTHRFGKDTGEIERMLMEYLQQRKTQFRIPFRIFYLIPKDNLFLEPVYMMQNPYQKLMTSE
jgi:hypothetical protein